jgi:hypothetical protein
MKAYERPAETLPRTDGTHEQNWIDGCKGGPAPNSNFEIAVPLNEIIMLGNVGIRAQEKKILKYDGANMVFTNSAAATELLTRKNRAGWELKL